jgi:hypothetical protein
MRRTPLFSQKSRRPPQPFLSPLKLLSSPYTLSLSLSLTVSLSLSLSHSLSLSLSFSLYLAVSIYFAVSPICTHSVHSGDRWRVGKQLMRPVRLRERVLRGEQPLCGRPVTLALGVLLEGIRDGDGAVAEVLQGRDSPIVKHYSSIKNSCFVNCVNDALCSYS